jgi:hypothetical protein
LVRNALDAHLKDKQRISLATVAAKSKQEARAYYEQYRT